MSKKNPQMCPKRVSKRYAVTREDRQLDPRKSSILSKGIKVHPVPCPVNGKRKYRLDLEKSNDNIHGLDSLSEEINMSGYQVSLVENMLNMLLDVVPRYIARTGHSVRIGNLLTLKPFATGTLEYANDATDPANNRLEIRGTISPALRHSLARVPLVNVSQRIKGLDFAINNANGSRRDEIKAKFEIIINGTGIYVPPQSAADENTRGKVWFETMDGRRLGRCSVSSSGPNAIIARFVPDAPVDVDEGRLFVETYGTKEAAEAGDRSLLQRYSHDIRFIRT
jgi:hypothetical protein